LELTPVFETESSVFSEFVNDSQQTLHVLRGRPGCSSNNNNSTPEGQVTIEAPQKYVLPLILVSEPIMYEDCAWQQDDSAKTSQLSTETTNKAKPSSKEASVPSRVAIHCYFASHSAETAGSK